MAANPDLQEALSRLTSEQRRHIWRANAAAIVTTPNELAAEGRAPGIGRDQH